MTPSLWLLDLVAALEWVRDHIADYGGDPGRVLAAGQSAGGAAVLALVGVGAADGSRLGVGGSGGSEVPGGTAVGPASSSLATTGGPTVDDMARAAPSVVAPRTTTNPPTARMRDFALIARQVLPTAGMARTVLDGTSLHQSTNDLF